LILPAPMAKRKKQNIGEERWSWWRVTLQGRGEWQEARHVRDEMNAEREACSNTAEQESRRAHTHI